jgi:hypothetical protein
MFVKKEYAGEHDVRPMDDVDARPHASTWDSSLPENVLVAKATEWLRSLLDGGQVQILSGQDCICSGHGTATAPRLSSSKEWCAKCMLVRACLFP